MVLSSSDWVIIIIYFIITLIIGFIFSKRAGTSVSEFFLSGRSLPWYIAGISMVATTFAADTPLAVTELVSRYGIAGNWIWWNFLIGGMLTTFFFAKYWRRANIMTEVELIDIRYGGKAAQYLRAFKAVYLGLFINILIIAWVNLAFMSILQGFFGIAPDKLIYYLAVIMLVIALYSTLSGLWGVAANDTLQFFIAMTGSIVLAVFVIQSKDIGGIENLKKALPEGALNFFPSGNTDALALGFGAFFAFIGIQWWASWYPGAEPGGGGYIAQRMMSTKNEKHAWLSSLFFQIAHYCIRPWPWILVGLASMVLYPHLAEDAKKLGYVMAMKEYLPSGWRGLMLVAFSAAYMSTISTQLNWGVSYIVNDFFKQIRKNKKQRELVAISRLSTLVIAVAALLFTTQVKTITGVWQFIFEFGAGLGLVLILRWYWWRINVWSEITATIAPLVFYVIFAHILHWEYPFRFYMITLFTSISWLTVTLLGKAESTQVLQAFYNRIKPDGAWGAFRTGEEKKKRKMGAMILVWLLAVLLTYCTLFATGYLILHEWKAFQITFAVWLLVLFFFILLLKKMPEEKTEQPV
jgi:solute:Na+ symporter, SSS family